MNSINPTSLPEPIVESCIFPTNVQPAMPALRLSWPADGQESRTWNLPCGAQRMGPPPSLFGIVIKRTAADRYGLRLIWDDSYLDWRQLRRRDLQSCSLRDILAALGTSLDEMLDQPVAPPHPPLRYLPTLPDRAA